MKILVCDGDAFSRAVLARTVEELGHVPVQAEDGESAWKAFANDDVECVFADSTMPRLSGGELCRRVRAHSDRSWAYLLLLVAHRAKATAAEGLEAGADDFLPKPFDPDALRARLHGAERVLALERALRARSKDLDAARTEVETLRGLLPVCLYCKRIRDEREAWQAVEEYVARHGGSSLDQGVCPGCWEDVVKPMLADLKSPAPRAP